MIETYLEENGIKYRELTFKERRDLCKMWLDKFAGNVKTETGKYEINGNWWEAYTSNVEPHLSGEKAVSEYHSQNIEKYYLLLGRCDGAYECESKSYFEFPDFGDIYVCNYTFKWSVAWPHEPGYGPYFSYGSKT